MNCFVFQEESSRQIRSTTNLSTTESSSASGFFSFNSVSQSSASFPNSMSIDTAESRTDLVHIVANLEEFERPKKLHLLSAAAVSTELKLEIPRPSWRELAEQNEYFHWPNFNGTTTVPNQESANFRIPACSTVMEIRGFNPENHAIMLFDERKHDGVTIEQDFSVAVKQKFTIREISPKWGYSTEATKVIIVGTFLCEPSESAWSCMFGDIEVPLEIIQTGVLCCEAPPHLPGKVTFCVTSDNRQSCSEIREFEYRGSCIHCNELSKGSAELEAELTVNRFSAIEDLDSLKNVLAAVRIQSAFRAHCFRKRQQREAAVYANGTDEYGIADIQTLSAMSKLAFFNTRDYKSAALSIQKKYRRWKARKDFIALRQKVVKIQAHVRGYQAGKQRNIISAVGILEKAMEAQRSWFERFSSVAKPIDETGNEDILKEFSKQKVDAAIDEAISQVGAEISQETRGRCTGGRRGGDSNVNMDTTCLQPHLKERKRKVKRSIKVPAISSKEADVPVADEYSWRKYGQKRTKDSPHPRGYYKCSSLRGCPARKEVQRCLDDPTMITVTYVGEHNHLSGTIS